METTWGVSNVFWKGEFSLNYALDEPDLAKYASHGAHGWLQGSWFLVVLSHLTLGLVACGPVLKDVLLTWACWSPVGCCRRVPQSCQRFEWFAITLFCTWRCRRSGKVIHICKGEWQEQCGLSFTFLTREIGRMFGTIDRKVYKLHFSEFVLVMMPSDCDSLYVNVLLEAWRSGCRLWWFSQLGTVGILRIAMRQVNCWIAAILV